MSQPSGTEVQVDLQRVVQHLSQRVAQLEVDNAVLRAGLELATGTRDDEPAPAGQVE